MYKKQLRNPLIILFVILTVIAAAAQTQQPPVPLTINAGLRTTFRFVAYGDTRFTDPTDTKAANPEVRQQLVRGIADAHPDFITFGGDIAYNGDKVDDWKVYDQETAIWRERTSLIRSPVKPRSRSIARTSKLAGSLRQRMLPIWTGALGRSTVP